MKGPLAGLVVFDLTRILAGPHCTQILGDLGVHRIRLLSNQPRRIVGLEGFDLSVEETVKLSD